MTSAASRTWEDPEASKMATRSWRGIIVGVLIALGLPILYSVAALLFSSGIVQFTRTGFLFELSNSLSLNAAAEFVFGMLGILVAGRAARLQSTWAWLGLYLVALPVLAFVWFLSYATLGGAMGSPF
jgi:hypothetical protein